MSVFSCRQLPDDWQIAPLAPVLSGDGNASLNADNYLDTDHGAVQSSSTKYPNIPDVFTAVYPVAAGASWAVFQNVYDNAIAGSAVVLADGVYDWTGENLQFDNTNGTIDDPVYVIAENKHMAVITGASSYLKFYTPYQIIAGIKFDGVTQGLGSKIIENRANFLRVTACLFFNSTLTGINKPSLGGTQNNNLEIDNCIYDGNNLSNAGYFFSINTADGTNPANTTNQRYIRIHHNEMRNVAQGSRSSYANIGAGYKVDEREATNHNPWENNMFFHFENNKIENWFDQEEGATIKGGFGIIRNNLSHSSNGTVGNLIRLSNNLLFLNNWTENAYGRTRLSADKSIVAFNYSSREVSGNEAIALHQSETNPTGGLFDYIGADDCVIKNNVFSRSGWQVRVMEVAGANLHKENVTGTEVDNNHFYSTTMAGEDTSGTGGYTNDDGSQDETNFRANNTWGANVYTHSELGRSTVIDASHFDGPGTDLAAGSDFVSADLYGQPSIIKAPSWWALGDPPPAYSPDAQAVIDRMTGLSTGEKDAIAAFVDSQATAGNWAKIDEFFCFALTSNSANYLEGWKSKTATVSGNITQDASGIISGSIGNNYVDTNFDLGLDGSAFTAASGSAGVFWHEQQTVNGSSQDLFGVSDGVSEIRARHRGNDTEDTQFRCNTFSQAFINPIADAAVAGKLHTARQLAGFQEYLIDGVAQPTNSAPAPTGPATGFTVWVGQQNASGAAPNSAKIVRFTSFYIGAGDIDTVSFYNDLLTLHAALGVV